ncbi:ParB/RepB/Spo0J family partition protein [Chlamydia abortus]|uniref:Chromosome partitioning protein n=1 Tax=Chlamydia abortus (strain DSM 27085 / S26/3) TaxID=218497 RepID=Q5L753_CHLAB|nr:ParB/RepB/Spo0J family partition protein [Chlamydia abortus]ASD30249.1 chromosome partitioning protein ParB [Chlamydia abortus]AUS59481.1 chromosome/ plasmid partitioning protein ParB [Chlamydia abortus]EGK68839.1 putative chromosome partitioning protein [Chlamydia abortus LLG]QEM73443.1 ParB/RepB/Spo0J family partition protein [Chlamydia abortus]QRR31775.1 ParB/RepB/Spo0J family partition protein [Chlamydia abortus]
MSGVINKDTIIEVAIDNIRVSPFQPRRVFSESELQELVASLKSVGLIHPPVVREIRSGDRVLYYELIAGERRWRALQLAGYTTIPVVLKQVVADDIAAEATLIENIQRVNLSPMEMAEAFKKLINVFGLTQDKVAVRVGKKRSTVANYLRLFSLSESIQKSLYLGEITLGHAKVILTLEDPNLREILAEKIISQRLAVREAEQEAKKLLSGEVLTTRAAKEQVKACATSPHCHEMQKRLSQSLGYKVTVKPQGSHYSVSLHVQDEEQLKQLEEWLLKKS